MTEGPAVIDTNVVVSGLITGIATSPTARILDGMIAGRFSFFLSIDLIAEYRNVLTRPKIRERHKLSESQIDVILTDIVANGVMANVESAPPSRRKSDHHLRQILATALTAVLVTGDDRLRARLGKSTRTVSPREFADLGDGPVERRRLGDRSSDGAGDLCRTESRPSTLRKRRSRRWPSVGQRS